MPKLAVKWDEFRVLMSTKDLLTIRLRIPFIWRGQGSQSAIETNSDFLSRAHRDFGIIVRQIEKEVNVAFYDVQNGIRYEGDHGEIYVTVPLPEGILNAEFTGPRSTVAKLVKSLRGWVACSQAGRHPAQASPIHDEINEQTARWKGYLYENQRYICGSPEFAFRSAFLRKHPAETKKQFESRAYKVAKTLVAALPHARILGWHSIDVTFENLDYGVALIEGNLLCESSDVEADLRNVVRSNTLAFFLTEKYSTSKNKTSPYREDWRESVCPRSHTKTSPYREDGRESVYYSTPRAYPPALKTVVDES